MEIPFKKLCNALKIPAEIFSELNALSSKVSSFDEELLLTFEVDSSSETGGSLAEEDLEKQYILLTSKTYFFHIW